jgi:hypothetical protein
MKTNIMIVAAVISVAPAISSAAGAVTVNAAEYGDKWPFTVNQVTLSCQRYRAVVITTSDGKTYAYNRKAKSQLKHLPDASTITKPSPYGPRTYMPDPGLIERGLELCPK